MIHPSDFYKPLAINAPTPLKSHANMLQRMIHFFPPHNEKIQQKIGDIADKCDVVLGNLEDGIPANQKNQARQGLIDTANRINTHKTHLWTRINALDSPWCLDDITLLMQHIPDKLSVMMVPKVETARDIYYMDRLLAQLEAKYGVKKPMSLHAIIETAKGVINMESIAQASPRMQGMSLGPADLAASRNMKTTRVGGGHPDYGVYADPCDDTNDRAFYQADIWHYTLARMVDACRANNILAFYGPFADFTDTLGCRQQFRNAFLLGCVGTWTLHPSQIEIAREVFSPPKDEVEFAYKIVSAIPDGSGAVLVDGKMQDDATVKQAQNLIDLAKLVEDKDS